MPHFATGPGAGTAEISVTADALAVTHRPRVNGVLQSPQTITLASGSTTFYLYRPESPQRQFAGEYWLPPGQIQEVTVHVTSASAKYGSTTKPIKFASGGVPTSSGTLHFVTSGNKPEIVTAEPTGVVAIVPSGGPNNALSAPDSTTLVLDTSLTAGPHASPLRFPYDSDELVVYFLPTATSQQISNLYQTTGATEVMSTPSGMRILRFNGATWSTILGKQAIYRSSSLVGVASLNPVLTPMYDEHDPDIYDDPWYESWESAYLADIGVEAAWDVETGNRDVIIGFVDTGLDYNHPDLVNSLWVNEGELPDVCGNPFVDTFDLDGDGIFTLHDRNAPDDAGQLAAALADLFSCEGLTLSAETYDESVTGADDGVYQGGDLLAVFADNVDDDANGVVDDFFGADFTGTVSSCGTGGDPTNEVMDDDNHGTQMAGIVGAGQDNDRNIAGIMGDVRIIEARMELCGWSALDHTDGAAGEMIKAVDYLEAMEAQIVVVEHSLYTDAAADFRDAELDKWALEYEDRGGVLFVVPAHSYGIDCDDPNIFCPASADAANVVGVAATGLDYVDADEDDVPDVTSGVMDGLWEDPNPATDFSGRIQKSSNYGVLSIDLAAPGQTAHDDGGVYYQFVPSLGLGDALDGFGQWNPAVRSGTGATSAAGAVIGGVAGLLLSHCPTAFADGAQLRTALLAGANSSPEVSIAGRVAGGRYIDAQGALGECP